MVIVGGGVGGCAAALAATELGCKVLMIEETNWIGGQLTSQGVPPDEHRWIESHGRTESYARLRTGIRRYYRDHFPMTAEAMDDPLLNPGQGWVSALCCKPRVALAVIEEMLAPAVSAGLLEIRTGRRICGAHESGDFVRSAVLLNIANQKTETVTAYYYLDATETGDLLPLAGAEYVTGAESRERYHEFHAPDSDQPDNVQALTWCMAVARDRAPDASHVIDKPAMYDFWRDYTPRLTPMAWPNALFSDCHPDPVTLRSRRIPILSSTGELDLFTYRRIVSGGVLNADEPVSDVTLINWPQNDYLLTNIIDKPDAEVRAALNEAKQLSLSLLYWLQTEAPRPDGAAGYPELTPAQEIFGTVDGLAIAPYIRESRRIKAVFTVTEEHVGAQMLAEARRDKAVYFPDSVGVGYYRIDLHPSTGGDNYIDVESRPFQIPLGALLPKRLRNLLPACKNIGTTHITNGCYRLHPVEWNIGESAGYLAAWCVRTGRTPHEVRENADLLAEFQQMIRGRGVQTEWPE